jgi:phage repressor protein C with HTH and peptisase S24 domain
MLLIRKVAGTSMLPVLQPDRLVIAAPRRRIRSGDIVVIAHDGLEKVKRVADMRGSGARREIYLLGDNPPDSTDGRHFGWLPMTLVKGKVVWPLTTFQK